MRAFGQGLTLSFHWAAAPTALYNLCLILEILLKKSCCKNNCNLTLLATIFIYKQIQLHILGLTHLPSVTRSNL